MLPLLLLVAAAHAWPRDDRLYAEEERVLFAGGCFWSVELAFQRVPGVIRTAVGYAGGHTLSPVTYEAVVTGTTGHAETVEVIYDPQRVSFERLVDLFWQLHDPTSLNQQGGDAGTQYRSAIWYTSEAQRAGVAASLAKLPADVKRRVVTQVSSATAKGFLWEAAEGYHRAPPPTLARHPCVRQPPCARLWLAQGSTPDASWRHCPQSNTCRRVGRKRRQARSSRSSAWHPNPHSHPATPPRATATATPRCCCRCMPRGPVATAFRRRRRRAGPTPSPRVPQVLRQPWAHQENGQARDQGHSEGRVVKVEWTMLMPQPECRERETRV